MDKLAPTAFSRFRRFRGALRVGLCLLTLATIVSAVNYDHLMNCSLTTFIAIPIKATQATPPPERLAERLWLAWNVLQLVSPFFLALLTGLVGGLGSLYVALCWRPTPFAAWLTGLTLGCTGLLMLAGQTLRWTLGEAAALAGGRSPTLDLPLWPLGLLTLGVCYILWLRARTPPLPPVRHKAKTLKPRALGTSPNRVV